MNSGEVLQMNPTREVHPKIDVTSLTEDPDLSNSFRKEGKYPKPPQIKIVRDRQGTPYFLKTNFVFIDRSSDTWLTPTKAKNYLMRTRGYYDYIADANLRGPMNDGHDAVRAYRISKLMNGPIPYTEAIEFEGTPCTAMEYLGEVIDTDTSGRGLDFTRKPAQANIAVAKGAIIKFLTRNNGDGGQYFQQQDGTTVLGDIHFDLQTRLFPEWINKFLTAIALQGEKTDHFFLKTQDGIEHQLEGLRTREVRGVLSQLAAMTPERAATIISPSTTLTPDEVATIKWFVKRAHAAATIFSLLAAHPEESLIMLNPIGPTKKTRLYTPDQVNTARMSIYANLNQQSGEKRPLVFDTIRA